MHPVVAHLLLVVRSNIRMFLSIDTFAEFESPAPPIVHATVSISRADAL